MWKTEALLTAIGSAAPRECITEADLVRLTGAEARSVEMSCLLLRKHGLLTKTGRGCHRLTDAGRAAFEQGAKLRSGPQRPYTGRVVKTGTLRERAWLAIRTARKFTIDDLIMLAVRGGERGVYSNLRRYVRALELAGYLQRLPVREARSAPTSNGAVRWMLVNNTGRLTPTWSPKHGTVYDPNLECDMPLAAREAA
jgi:hypothetical protein